MPDKPTREQIDAVKSELAQLVSRALIQAGDLRDVEDQLKVISAKASKATPPPELAPEQDAPEEPGDGK